MPRARKTPEPVEPARFYHDGTKIPLAVIRRYAKRIAERFEPDKIVLFGSQAYGTPHADSDVDILVVMRCRDQVAQAMRIDREIPAPFAMDPIVRTPHNIGWRMAEREWFHSHIVAQGKLLYEKAEGESFHTEIVTKGKVLYAKGDARVGEEGGRRPARGRRVGHHGPSAS